MKAFVVAAAAIAACCSQALAETECEVTMAQYGQLREGMSYAAAVSVLGCEGEETASSETMGIRMVMYTWYGTTLMGNMNAMFQDGRMVSKAQMGLE
jgi:hypothetical protein